MPGGEQQLHAGQQGAAVEACGQRGKRRRGDAHREGESGDELGCDRNIDAEPMRQRRQHSGNDQGAGPDDEIAETQDQQAGIHRGVVTFLPRGRAPAGDGEC
jgi:hypothetical protein